MCVCVCVFSLEYYFQQFSAKCLYVHYHLAMIQNRVWDSELDPDPHHVLLICEILGAPELQPLPP